MNLVKSEDFPKHNKIRNTNLFNSLFNTGRRSNLKSVSIITTANHLGFPRLGISVSKKNMPKAVQRNRIKRILREFFRKNKKLIGSTDLIVICNKSKKNMFKSYKAEDINNYFTQYHEQ